MSRTRRPIVPVYVAEGTDTNARAIYIPSIPRRSPEGVRYDSGDVTLTFIPGEVPTLRIRSVSGMGFGAVTIDGVGVTPTGYSAVADFADRILRTRWDVAPVYHYAPERVPAACRDLP